MISNPACSLIVSSPALPASQTQGQGAYISSMKVSVFPYLVIESNGKWGGEELGLGRGETVNKKYCIRNESIFNKRKINYFLLFIVSSFKVHHDPAYLSAYFSHELIITGTTPYKIIWGVAK